MSRAIEITDIPDDVHRRLEARAALNGLSLSAFILNERQEIASRPTIAEVLERLRQLPEVVTDVPSAELIREYRDQP